MLLCCYLSLKSRLLAAHDPTTCQQKEVLCKMEPHVLHSEDLPLEEHVFSVIFLKCLPRELQVLIGDNFIDPQGS